MNSAPEHIRFCAYCGCELITRPVGGKMRRVCPRDDCHYVYFTEPKVGVGVLVIHNDQVLLIKRGVHPFIGQWSLPAGYLDAGEDPAVTAVREVYEETNLTIAITNLINVYHLPPNQPGASIFILYQGQYLDGTIQAGDDAREAVFFPRHALPELAFDTTRQAIHNWLAQTTINQ
ncbi:MAG TPA: NUDIX domain-containing protein [Anaerolineae bacterium]|nr:NUDIX domain-containing protein [Anaerolineae bacterium]